MTFVPSTGVGWGRDGVRGASARRASATVLAAAVLSALLFAVGGAARPDAAAAAQDKIVIFQGAYLDGFRRWDGAAAERLFSNRRTYLIVDQNYPRIPLGWDARPTLMFKYLRDFKQAVEQDLIPPEVEAVIYNVPSSRDRRSWAPRWPKLRSAVLHHAEERDLRPVGALASPLCPVRDGVAIERTPV